MTPYYEDDMVTLWHGDCRQVMSELGEASVDAIVTDPPYELAFMGKGWDASGIAYDRRVWENAWHVLKPGGHLLAFGGTRTWHRLAVAIEDAGFEVRDSIAWMYGSGFPKSLDVSKAIDKANGRQFEDRYALGRHIKEQRTALGLSRAEVNAWFGYRDGCEHWERQDPSGARVPTLTDWVILRERLRLSDEWQSLVERIAAEREVVGSKAGNLLAVAPGQDNDRSATTLDITAPATPAAQQWQGWGTALKPAFEPIVVARKPLIGTVAENVLAHGTGALNIDGCRIAGEVPSVPQPNIRRENYTVGGSDGRNGEMSSAPGGRWPANVILDESQAAVLDKQSGKFGGQVGMRQTSNNLTFGVGHERDKQTFDHGTADFGGASRFFYTAKADSSERPRVDGVAHPTVKPLDLMRYLVRLVTPPGGTVLEPFAGSGTTLEACVMEGFHAIGIELTDEYLPLIRQRLSKPIEQVLL